MYDEDGVTIVQKATSDANGIASFSNLIKEHYLIKETKAPEGYQLSDEKIQVNAAQLKNYGSGIIYKDFTNRKALVTASGTKTWNDDNDKDGKRPNKITVRLYTNDAEVDHKEVGPNDKGEWKYADFYRLRLGIDHPGDRNLVGREIGRASCRERV